MSKGRRSFRKKSQTPTIGRVFTLLSKKCTLHILGEDHILGPKDSLPPVHKLLVEYDVFYRDEPLPPFGQTPTTREILNKIDSAFSRSCIQPDRLPEMAVGCDVREACHVLKDPGLERALQTVVAHKPSKLKEYLQYRTLKLLDPPRAVQQRFTKLIQTLSLQQQHTFHKLFQAYKKETSSLANFELRSYSHYPNVKSESDIAWALYSIAPQKLTDFFFVLNILSCRNTPIIGVLCGFDHVASLQLLLAPFGFV